MIDQLRAALERAQSGTPQGSLDTAVGVYKEAACYISALEELQKQAKLLITDIFAELGAVNVTTSCGRAYVTKPGFTVRYDSTGLDELIAGDPMLANALAPYRQQVERPGVLTIR
jgi:hypothetical protein